MSSRSARVAKVNSLIPRSSHHGLCTVTTQERQAGKNSNHFLNNKRMLWQTSQIRATLRTEMKIAQTLTQRLKRMLSQA